MDQGGSPALKLVNKLNKVRNGLIGWRKRAGRNEQKEIIRLKEELRQAYQQPTFNGFWIREMEVELKRAIRNEEIYWQMKSRVQWLREGDKNTRFFHAQTVKIKKRNAIRGLEEEDGMWSTNRQRIQDVYVRYFHTLFSSNSSMSF